MSFLPEMSLLLDRDRARSGRHITRDTDSPWPSALQAMARKHGIWLHSGSMPLLADDGERRVNRSHVIPADGGIRAQDRLVPQRLGKGRDRKSTRLNFSH